MPFPVFNKKDKSGATPSLTDCAYCGAPQGTIPGIIVHKPCSQCMIAHYCSVKCQKGHWKLGGHKQTCVPVANRCKPVKSCGSGAAAAEEEECSICLEPLSKSQTTKLPCNHTYHNECIDKLRSLGVQQTCPLCRADLPSGPQQLFDEALHLFLLLSRRYSQGEDNPWHKITDNDDLRDIVKVVRILTKLANQGYQNAQYQLGRLYMKGHGVDANYVKAKEWYHKAASKGQVFAQLNLGFMYSQASKDSGGSPQMDTLAVEWHRKAADQGYAPAQYNLGMMYAKGECVSQNFTKALRWLRKAEAQGLNVAQIGIQYTLQLQRKQAAAY